MLCWIKKILRWQEHAEEIKKANKELENKMGKKGKCYDYVDGRLKDNFKTTRKKIGQICKNTCIWVGDEALNSLPVYSNAADQSIQVFLAVSIYSPVTLQILFYNQSVTVSDFRRRRKKKQKTNHHDFSI